MASPQKENGYTPIANEILEQIAKIPLNGTQFRILMTVWRFTYGFNRKSHSLSETFLAKATQIHKMQIARELRTMVHKRILLVVKEATFNTSKEIAFNKNYSEWIGIQLTDTLPVSELVYSKLNSNETVSESVYPTVSESAYQEIHIKDNKEINTLGDFQSPPESNNSKISNAELDIFFETIWKLYPKKRGKGEVSKTQKTKLFKIGYEELSRCIERYKKSIEKDKTESQYIQYGSTFFNSGYVDFLDVNYLQDSEKRAIVPISDNPDDWRGF